jgi:hypothetical protein
MRFEGLKDNIGLGLIGPLSDALDLVDKINVELGLLQGFGDVLGWLGSGLGNLMAGNPYGNLPGAPEAKGSGVKGGLSMLGAGGGASGTSAAEKAATQAYYDAIDKLNAKGPKSTLERMREKGTNPDRALWEGMNQLRVDADDKLFASTGKGKGKAKASSLGLPDYLAQAFPDIGSAMAWQGAFSGEHGGRAATQVDLRDKQAGDLFAQKYGRAATQGEWEQRYYKGSFEGVDETGLDELFGPSGTLATKLDEQRKQDKESFDKLLAAFEASDDKTYTVKLQGRLTD